MIDVTSTVRGTVWPAIPSPFVSQLLAMQFQLEASQWLSADELLERQMRQLGRLLAHAYDTVPFYRARLDAAGLPIDQIRGPAEWLKIPLLSRADIQVAQKELLSSSVPDEHGPKSQLVTSGSTGRPVMIVGTAVTQLFWNACTLRDHLWHRRIPGGTLAAIRSLPQGQALPPEGAAGDDWGPATRGIVRTGRSYTLTIHSSVDEQAEWLVKRDPNYLLTYPSNVHALVQHSQRHGWRLSNLLEVRTFGELLEPPIRRACRQAWGMKTVDMYSSQEVGYIALQCPTTDNYHVQSENVLVEVLNEAGQPCAPGEVGRVVITALHNYAMPLLRYDIGDYAEVARPCPCGRGLTTLKRIVGRQRNMAILPDGSRRWPSLEIDDAGQLGAMPPIQQFQLVQRSLSQMELSLITPRPLQPDEEDLVRRWVVQAVGYPFDVALRYVETIPRSPTGKFEDFRCEAAGDQARGASNA